MPNVDDFEGWVNVHLENTLNKYWYCASWCNERSWSCVFVSTFISSSILTLHNAPIMLSMYLGYAIEIVCSVGRLNDPWICCGFVCRATRGRNRAFVYRKGDGILFANAWGKETKGVCCTVILTSGNRPRVEVGRLKLLRPVPERLFKASHLLNLDWHQNPDIGILFSSISLVVLRT